MTDPILLEEIGRAIGAALADANALAPPSEELSSAATSASPTGTSTAASAGSSGSAPATTQPPSTPGAPAQTAGLSAGYLPFASLADVRAWQASYESGGHQPWHRNPDLTATGGQDDDPGRGQAGSDPGQR